MDRPTYKVVTFSKGSLGIYEIKADIAISSLSTKDSKYNAVLVKLKLLVKI